MEMKVDDAAEEAVKEVMDMLVMISTRLITGYYDQIL